MLYLQRTVGATSSFHLLPGIICYLSLDVLVPPPPPTTCQASRWKQWYFASFYPFDVWPVLGTVYVFGTHC